MIVLRIVSNPECFCYLSAGPTTNNTLQVGYESLHCFGFGGASRFNLRFSASVYRGAVMSEVRSKYDGEIDLFEFLETLWNGKWFISIFVAIAVLLGSGFLFFKEAAYQSKVFYSIDSYPPFYDDNKVLGDFQTKFFSPSVFAHWKEINSDTSLIFEDFRGTAVVDGFVVSKTEDEMLATFVSEDKGGKFILIKTNQLLILDDFFKYATHVNGILKREYVLRSTDELKIIEHRLDELNDANQGLAYQNLNTYISIKRYISSANQGTNLLEIKNPTIPIKVSPKSKLIIAVSLVLGGMGGVLFILVLGAIKKRAEQLAEA
jgi:hypothetical protein